MSDANDEALLGRLVGALAPVPGVEAIALGGARIYAGRLWPN